MSYTQLWCETCDEPFEAVITEEGWETVLFDGEPNVHVDEKHDWSTPGALTITDRSDG